MRRVAAVILLALGSLALDPYGALIAVVRNGQAPDDNFGEAVAGGADVNGDGIPDHVVTAIYNDEAASNAGKAYLYLGRAPARGTADLSFLGEAADDQFGVSVAAGGDVNGDGYADIAVGARFNDRAAKDAGAVFVYFGGPDPGAVGGMDALPDLVLTGEYADDWFGNSVSFAGDVNGDGFDDILVGAPYNDDNGSAAGKAYIYFGGPVPDAVPDVILFGDPQGDSHFGWSVSGAGDVNADGFADVVVGARLWGQGPSRAAGRAYVFLGSANPDGSPDVIMTGERADDWFGNTVAGIGDFNHDGYDDVAVGAIYYDDMTDPLAPLSAAGRVYVFYGGPTGSLDGVADWVATGERADDQFGHAIAGAGDVDENGADDLLVGAWFYDDTSGATSKSAAGKAYLFFGAAAGGAPATAAGFIRVGRQADDQFGASMGRAGDGNRDGEGEFLVGAHYADINGSGSGSATLHFLDCLSMEMSGDQIAWGGCGAYSSYDLRRGSPSGLAAGDSGSCLSGDLQDVSAIDATQPAPGEILTYLVSGRGDPSLPDTAEGFDSMARGRPARPTCP